MIENIPETANLKELMGLLARLGIRAENITSWPPLNKDISISHPTDPDVWRCYVQEQSFHKASDIKAWLKIFGFSSETIQVWAQFSFVTENDFSFLSEFLSEFLDRWYFMVNLELDKQRKTFLPVTTELYNKHCSSLSRNRCSVLFS